MTPEARPARPARARRRPRRHPPRPPAPEPPQARPTVVRVPADVVVPYASPTTPAPAPQTDPQIPVVTGNVLPDATEDFALRLLGRPKGSRWGNVFLEGSGQSPFVVYGAPLRPSRALGVGGVRPLVPRPARHARLRRRRVRRRLLPLPPAAGAGGPRRPRPVPHLRLRPARTPDRCPECNRPVPEEILRRRRSAARLRALQGGGYTEPRTLKRHRPPHSSPTSPPTRTPADTFRQVGAHPNATVRHCLPALHPTTRAVPTEQTPFGSGPQAAPEPSHRPPAASSRPARRAVA